MSLQNADPRHYLEPAVLRDGGSVILQAVAPSDGDRLVAFFGRLSPETIRSRFFGSKAGLTEKEVAYYSNLDFVTHVGLLALLREKGEEHVVGVGRYCVAAPRKATSDADANARRAEIALTVTDEHQGRGVGTLLLEHLARIAQAQGIEELEATVMAGNSKMMQVFAESGFEVRESLTDGIYHVTFPTKETDAFLRASVTRERQAAKESVRVFFEPKSVAVIGASRREGSIGGAILANLKRRGFRGPIFPIHPEARELEGLPCFPRIGATGAKVDLAIVSVPADAVEKVVAECAEAQVRGVVVISSGFAEVSKDGKKTQDRLVRFVRSAGMRLVGPNCMGVLNATPEVSLDATFAPCWPPSGNVSILTQSGALGLAMLDYAAQLNIGMAGFVSVGNKADVSVNDLLSYWADDPRTDVIALYLESFGNPRTFARIAPEIARKKPIVAVKSGRSAAGTRAAASHSAALASLDVGVDALFAQAGVIRTNTLEELFDVVALLSTQPVPDGPRVGVVTNAGGPGILLADACEAHGLRLPALDATTIERLKSFLPSQAGFNNPIDMIASARPEHYVRTIEVVGNDANVDALVVIYIPPLVTKPQEVAEAIARAAASVPSFKPIMTVFMSSKGTPSILSTGKRGKIPSYSFPENAAIALSAAMRYGQWRKQPQGVALTLDMQQQREIRKILARVRADASAPQWVPMTELARILAIAKIPLAPVEQTLPDADAAAVAAGRIGYPVVLKAVAPGVVHKSDVGGVSLGLQSADAVRDAVRAMAARFKEAGHPLEGVLLQRQIEGGVEALVGVTIDPSLGPVLVAGLGGVQVELLRDVAFRLPPVSDRDAAEMLDGLRSAKLLDGFRGSPAADRSALLTLIQRLSALVDVVPELLELEMNPVKVLPRGKGVVAVDARMRIGPA